MNTNTKASLTTLSVIFILLTTILSACFITGLMSGFVALIFGAVVISLEAAKFYMLHTKKSILSWILISAIGCTSVAATYGMLSTSINSYNQHSEQISSSNEAAQKKYQDSLLKYELKLEEYKSALVINKSRQERINYDMNRVDRNKITDQRIADDRKSLIELNEPIRPEAPVLTEQPMQIPVQLAFLAFLIELTGWYLNIACFHRSEKTTQENGNQINVVQPVQSVVQSSEPLVQEVQPTEPQVEPPVENNTFSSFKPVTISYQAVIQTPVVEPQPEAEAPVEVPEDYSIIKELGCTNGDRLFLSRYAKKNNIPWKEFNTPSYFEKAAELLKERK